MKDVLRTRYNDKELEEFKRYYGAHPDLLKGFYYIGNVEGSAFLSKVTGTADDVSMH